METNKKLSLWRKILIAILSDIALVSIFLLKDHASLIVDYDTSRYYIDDYWPEETRIGNITNYDSRDYRLNDNWANIGNIYWHLQDENITDLVPPVAVAWYRPFHAAARCVSA